MTQPEIILTQEDIDAANAWAEENIRGDWWRTGDLYQTFALHRTKAEQRAREEALEEAIRWHEESAARHRRTFKSPEQQGSFAAAELHSISADYLRNLKEST